MEDIFSKTSFITGKGATCTQQGPFRRRSGLLQFPDFALHFL